MAFTIPQMPLTVNIWRSGLAYTAPPSVVSACNLAWGARVNTQGAIDIEMGSVANLWSRNSMLLLLPKRTDIRGYFPGLAWQDNVEVPAGSKRYYNVVYVDDIGRGFANEHRAAVLQMTTPVTYPLA